MEVEATKPEKNRTPLSSLISLVYHEESDDDEEEDDDDDDNTSEEPTSVDWESDNDASTSCWRVATAKVTMIEKIKKNETRLLIADSRMAGPSITAKLLRTTDTN